MSNIAVLRRALRVMQREGFLAFAVRLRLRLSMLLVGKRVRYAHSRAMDIATSDLTAQQKFEAIYRDRIWVDASPTLVPSTSLSGHGSTEKSTRLVRAELEAFLAEGRATSFFDAPCGDYHWMNLVKFPSSCAYIGGDIVPSVINKLNRDYGPGEDLNPVEGQPHRRRFIIVDLSIDRFPECDVWFCKDCLQHLSNLDVIKVLKNFARSNTRLALLSNHTHDHENKDIPTGGFRHLDLTKPPFNLPQPRSILRDSPVDRENRSIFVWRRDDLLDAISRL